MNNDYFNNILIILKSFSNHFEIKIFGAILIPIYSFFFNANISNMMLGLFFLIIFDSITGISAAKVNKVRIESRKIIKGAFKLAVYGILISSMHITDNIIQLDNFKFNLELGMMGFLAATEAISIIENVGKMGYSIPQKLLNMLENTTQKNNDISKK